MKKGDVYVIKAYSPLTVIGIARAVTNDFVRSLELTINTERRIVMMNPNAVRDISETQMVPLQSLTDEELAALVPDTLP